MLNLNSYQELTIKNERRISKTKRKNQRPSRIDSDACAGGTGVCVYQPCPERMS